jgi:hypothetical protein
VRPRAAQALRQAGGPEDLKVLQARMRSDFDSVGTASASLVNYASVLPGAKKYDASGLTR